jgi:tetratricopeptide (TPR) repeat protein
MSALERWRRRWREFWGLPATAGPAREAAPALLLMAAAGALVACWWLFSGGGRAPSGGAELPGTSARRQRDPASIAPLRAVVKQQPYSSSAHARLADEYLKHDYLAAAAGEFREALALDEKNQDALLGLAGVAARAGDTEAAQELSGAAVAQRPQDLEALHALGVTRAQGGRMKEAVETFERALALRPEDPVLLLNAAACYAELRDWTPAEACCRRALESAPRNPLARRLLASFYFAQGKNDQGTAETERLAADHPGDAGAQATLGQLRLSQSRLDDALAAFKAAQRLDPQWARPYLDAGITCLRQKHPEEAARYLDQALQRSPDPRTARLGLALVWDAYGDAPRAIAAYEQALDAAPNDPVVLNNLAYAYAERGQRLDRALELARRAAAAQPQNGAVLDTLGWVCHRAGRDNEALPHLQEAVRRLPDNGAARYHLAQALAALVRRDEATETFRAALALGLPPAMQREAEAFLAPAR